MKFWMKVFILLMLVFLLFFNGLIWVQRTYINRYLLAEAEKELQQEVSQNATFEANALSRYLKDCFVGDAADREQETRLEDLKNASQDEIRPLMDSYLKNHTYQQKGIYLRLYKISRVNAEGYGTKLYYKDDTLLKRPVELSELESGEVKYVYNIFDGTLACAMRSLPVCEDYRLVYIQSYQAKSWSSVLNSIQIFGLIASILMAVFLLLGLWRLTKPVSDLAAATREYARGDHSQRIDPIGWDEFAELARLFNSMADETQRLELVEEDAERKQRFLDSFTHELRTPLTNIHGYSELMKRVQLSEEDRLRYLDYVMHESRRLNRLSEELFGLTVLRENTTRMERVSCGRLLDFAEQTLREKARKKDVRLVCEQSDCTVYGSKALLESLCINLCENAIRACEAGDEVRVSFREEEDGAVLRVADTGRGIAPEDLAHITEPFYRVDKARSRAEGGVGLGLYLCSEIVRIHGAAMSFDSREGEGTTVTVRFPKQEQN